MNITYRQFRTSDKKTVVELIKSLYREDPEGKPVFDEKINKTFNQLTKHPDKGTIMIVEVDSKIIGYSILINFWSNEYGGFRLAQDVPTDNVVTQDTAKDLTLKTLGEENMLVYTPEGKTKHTITVFVNFYSPYWRKLHRELNQYLAAGVKVRYLFIPVGEKSFDTTVSVWCADNSQQALDNVQSNKSIEEKNCKHPLGLHKQLAAKLGVKAVPTIILENGMKAEGYQSAKEIIKYLEKM